MISCITSQRISGGGYLLFKHMEWCTVPKGQYYIGIVEYYIVFQNMKYVLRTRLDLKTQYYLFVHMFGQYDLLRWMLLNPNEKPFPAYTESAVAGYAFKG